MCCIYFVRKVNNLRSKHKQIPSLSLPYTHALNSCKCFLFSKLREESRNKNCSLNNILQKNILFGRVIYFILKGSMDHCETCIRLRIQTFRTISEMDYTPPRTIGCLGGKHHF